MSPVRWLWSVPHRWFIAVALAIPLGCAIDTQLSLTEAQQWLLAIPVWFVVLGVLPLLPRDRQVMLLCFLPLILLAELLLSHGLGWYVYRLENVPPWIIPAHGVVFLTAMRAVDTTAVSTRTLAWAAGGAQALYGVLNLLLRGDEVGALLSVVYVVGMLVLPGDGKRFYAAIGLVVAYLEIIGSALGVWAWTPELFGLAETNPPSGAVGGYAMVDGAAYVLATYLVARVVGAGPGGRGAPRISRVPEPFAGRPDRS